MNEIPKDRLIGTIHSTFASRKRPKVIVVPGTVGPELVDHARMFELVDRDALDTRFLVAHSDGIHALTDDAFRYFLPAILCASVREGRCDLHAVDAIIGALDRANTRHAWDARFVERYGALTGDECRAVQQWVTWLVGRWGGDAFSQRQLTRAFDTLECLALGHRPGDGAAPTSVHDIRGEDEPPAPAIRSERDIKALAQRWVDLQRSGGKGDLEPLETVNRLINGAPDDALAFIHRVRALDHSDAVIANLAAGPLEGLLVAHGPAVVDRLVQDARRDPAFRHVLGGVWRSDIDEVVWNRLQAIVGERW